MGGKQYSRMLGLSRVYPYILYLKQLTAGMPGRIVAFPQSDPSIILRTLFLGGRGDPLREAWSVPTEADEMAESKRTCASSKSLRGQILCVPFADSTR